MLEGVVIVAAAQRSGGIMMHRSCGTLGCSPDKVTACGCVVRLVPDWSLTFPLQDVLREPSEDGVKLFNINYKLPRTANDSVLPPSERVTAEVVARSLDELSHS